jgi:GTP cyclohydrolase IA
VGGDAGPVTGTEQVDAESAVRTLLRYVGEDPAREGLEDTPRRVVRALAEMTVGYRDDPAMLRCTFDDPGGDELIVVRGIDFTSLCEHHMLPFSGTATVGYLPADRIIGLSKIPRLVHVYARRLQVQERLTVQIADALLSLTDASAVGVVIRARHSCMSIRGVRSPAEMVTSTMLGELRDNPAMRAEFMALGG